MMFCYVVLQPRRSQINPSWQRRQHITHHLMLSIIDPLDVVAVLCAITLYNTFIYSCFLVCCGY